MSEESTEPAERGKWDLGNPWVRGGIAGAIILIGATVLKTYQDSQKVDPAKERDTIAGVLERHHEALEANLTKANDRAAFLENLPEHSGWLPSNQAMICGQGSVARGALPSTWQKLWAVDEAKDEGDKTPLRYQIAFVRDSTSGAMTWYARRDGDCDGLYEVHTLRLEGGLTGALTRTRIEVQNMGE